MRYSPIFFCPMRLFSILAALALCPSATAQVQLQYPPVPGNYVRVLGGKTWIGSLQTSSTLGVYNQTVNHSQLIISPAVSPVKTSGNDVPLDARLDAAGNIWIVGNTDSDDFPLVNPIYSQKAPYATAGFVLELDPTGTKVLFSSFLAGAQAQVSMPYASHATVLAMDSTGNIYIGGDTDEPDFPLTVPGGKPGTSGQSTYFYSFLIKISPAAKLIYSTLLTTGAPNCNGGGTACTASTYANASSIAVDSTGAASVAGPQGGSATGVGYVAHLSPDGSKLGWLKTITISNNGTIDQLLMVQEPAGRFDLFGRYAPTFLNVSNQQYVPYSPPGLFTATLSADGTQVSGPALYGETVDAKAVGITLNATGTGFYYAGTSMNPMLVSENVPNLGEDFVMNGAIRFPAGAVTAPPVLLSDGTLQVLGAQGALLTIPPNFSFTQPAIVGFANGASFQWNSGFVQNAIVSLFGFGLPSNAQVLINGSPATVLYSGTNQINIVVPGNFYPGYPVTIATIATPSSTILFKPSSVPSVGIFTTGNGYAAALNQDGSANSYSNPAAGGSIVSVFGTGFSTGYGTDGVTATSIDPLEVLSFGPATGLPGVFRIDFRLPMLGYVSGSQIVVQTPDGMGGQLSSNTFTIFAR